MAGTRSLLRRRVSYGRLARGLGFATTVTLQEVSPFVFQEHFRLAVTSFGSIGLLLGVAYFSGAMLVNRVVKLGGVRLMMPGRRWLRSTTLMLAWLGGRLDHFGGLWIFIALYCLAIFGQAVLFPNSMATAVSNAHEHGASMALCGFQQGLAGIRGAAAPWRHVDARGVRAGRATAGGAVQGERQLGSGRREWCIGRTRLPRQQPRARKRTCDVHIRWVAPRCSSERFVKALPRAPLGRLSLRIQRHCRQNRESNGIKVSLARRQWQQSK